MKKSPLLTVGAVQTKRITEESVHSPFLFGANMQVRDKINLKNHCNIERPVFIKRINKDTVVFDYGEDSNFDIKFSFKTGRPVEDVIGWNDFSISTKDLETFKSLEIPVKIET